MKGKLRREWGFSKVLTTSLVGKEVEEKSIVREIPKHYILQLPLPKTSIVDANLMRMTHIESKRYLARNCGRICHRFCNLLCHPRAEYELQK
jgi:hypothetical protein